MTAPKRYEEMACGVMLSFGNPAPSFTGQNIDIVAEALRTAAREAQVRVLEELRDVAQSQETAAGRRACVVRVLEMIDRLENGEDL